MWKWGRIVVVPIRLFCFSDVWLMYDCYCGTSSGHKATAVWRSTSFCSCFALADTTPALQRVVGTSTSSTRSISVYKWFVECIVVGVTTYLRDPGTPGFISEWVLLRGKYLKNQIRFRSLARKQVSKVFLKLAREVYFKEKENGGTITSAGLKFELRS